MFATRLASVATAVVIAAAAFTSTTTFAGDVNGAGCVRDRVRASVTDVFRMTFAAGQPAAVAIRGDGDTDLDLEVRDDRGNRVCLSNGSSDRETCQWTPRWTGEFQIRIANLGAVYNDYYMCTN